MKRTKRGLINPLGSVFRSLLKTIDNDDRRQISEMIRNVVRNGESVKTLVNIQIQITTSVKESFNKTLNSVLYNEHVIHFNFLRLQKSVQENRNFIKQR